MEIQMSDFDMHHVYKKRASVLNKCHVIQIRSFNDQKICSCIYDNDTLYDLYKKSYETLFRNCGELRVEKYRQVRDFIPNEQYHVIHDIVLVDKKDNILSVPCDKNILFGDFKRANERYFIPCSRVPVLSVYKIYIVDNEAIEHFIKKRENQPPSVVEKIRRLLRCAF
uniref:Uncharacterized protein n=1 Tax=viral metagenome TaxID=1070528 RepID=A0A6C0B7A9_9ZZZZ